MLSSEDEGQGPSFHVVHHRRVGTNFLFYHGGATLTSHLFQQGGARPQFFCLTTWGGTPLLHIFTTAEQGPSFSVNHRRVSPIFSFLPRWGAYSFQQGGHDPKYFVPFATVGLRAPFVHFDLT